MYFHNAKVADFRRLLLYALRFKLPFSLFRILMERKVYGKGWMLLVKVSLDGFLRSLLELVVHNLDL
jgi:hypothetical protein